jgi:hypothetical protein
MKKTIRPREGKRYVTRSGWVTPPIKMAHTPYYVKRGYQKHGEDVTVHWDVDGNGWGTDGIIDDYDLVAEYVDETIPQGFIMIGGKMYKIMADGDTFRLVPTEARP